MSSSTSTHIREATRNDLDIVWQFILKKAAFDNWLDRLEATPEKIAATMFGEHPMAGVLLAELDSRVVGFATYYFTFSTYYARRCMWLDDLYVDESMRGQGIGKNLMQAMAKLSDKHNCPRMEWFTSHSNTKAISFYESMGAEVRHASRTCRLDRSGIANLAKSGCV